MQGLAEENPMVPRRTVLAALAAAAGRNRHRNARLRAHTAAANPVPQRKVLVKNRDLAGLLRDSSLEL